MSNKERIEYLIEGRCNALRVTEVMLNDLLAASEQQEHVFWGKELLVSFRLECGFTVTGKASCIDPANFDMEIGRLVAFEDARNQLWALEGYRLSWDLFERGILSPS